MTIVTSKFPLPASPIAGYSSFRELLMREGFRPFPRITDYINYDLSSAPTTLQGGNGTSMGAVWQNSCPIADFYLDDIEIVSTVDMLISVSVGLSTISNYSGQMDVDIFRIGLKANVPTVIPYARVLRGFLYETISFGTIISANAVANVRIKLNGVLLNSGDANFNAAKQILWLGDSITNGAGVTGFNDPLAKAKWYPRQFMDQLIKNGSDVRLNNQSISSCTTNDQEQLRANGKYDGLPNVGAICYSVGANDGAASVAAAAYIANVTKFRDWGRQRYPDAPFILFGPSPAENNTTESFLAQYRAAGQALAAADTSGKTKFFDLGTTFDRTQGTTVYMSTDTAGNRIHPNLATQASMGAQGAAWAASSGIVIN